MPAVYTRGLSLIAVTSVALLSAGCGARRAPNTTERTQDATAGQPTASTGAVPASSAPRGPSLRSSPTAGKRPPGTNGPTGAPPAGSVARPCRMADLRFWLSLATPMAGPYASGSVQMTNVAADRCRLSGYIAVRWLDPNGRSMPITVEHLPGSMPGYTSVVRPGKSAFAGLRWTRSRALPSDPDILCPPAPATLEARLSTENTFARMAWTPREGLCDSKAGIQPIEMIP
jgi:hypothetical protein